MKKQLDLCDLPLSNRQFWAAFLATQFPRAYDGDAALSDLIDQAHLADYDWWSDFTGYYDGVLDESDGYLEDPATFLHPLTDGQTLKIEFHPGDTLYYVNDKQIGCTGPHDCLQLFPLRALADYTAGSADKRLFLLLLPLTAVRREEADWAAGLISAALGEIVAPSDRERFAACIVRGLLEDGNT